MQHPTCVNIRVRSTQDAQKIIYAAYLGRLPSATRRLDGEERALLRSGHSYAWEEKPNNQHTGQGMERWTEGKKWGPSRVRDEFLFYYEQWVPPANLPPGASRDSPRGWEGLTKQTYSIQIKTPTGERKWHLNTYFTQATLDALGTIDDIPGVGDLEIPPGFMFSTKKGSKKSETKSSAAAKNSPSRQYAPYPLPQTSKTQPVAGPSSQPIAGPSTQPIAGPSTLPVAGTSPPLAGPSLLPHALPAPSILAAAAYPPLRVDVSTLALPGADPLLAPPEFALFPAPFPVQFVRRASVDSTPSSDESASGGYASTPSSTYSVPRALAPDEGAYMHASSSSLAHALGAPPPRRPGEKTLAPLSTLRRPHPYKRDALDDKTLRKLETRGAQ